MPELSVDYIFICLATIIISFSVLFTLLRWFGKEVQAHDMQIEHPLGENDGSEDEEEDKE